MHYCKNSIKSKLILMSNNTVQYSSEKLKRFENILNDNLDKANEELANIQKDQKDQKDHIVSTNTDFNGNSSHFQQQAKNRRHIQRLKRKSRELRAALKRIENETYGVCERSGQLIREERLIAMPTARFDIIRNN